MKLFYVLMSAFLAFCVMANDLPVKSLEDYESELREKYPFVERKVGDNVRFYIDGHTEVSGKVTEINDNGVMVENNGTGVFYSFQQLGIFGGRFFQKEKYDQWITRFAKVKMAQAAKLEARKLAKQRKAEQKKAEQQKDKQDNLEEKKKADSADGVYKIKNRIDEAFGVRFGYNLQTEITRYEKALRETGAKKEGKSDFFSFSIIDGDFPKFRFRPERPFLIKEAGEQKAIGKYYVIVIGEDRIAYEVVISEIPNKYLGGVIALLKKKYGNFEFDATKLQTGSIQLVSQRTPQRSITIHNHGYNTTTVTFHCNDLEERYKDKNDVSW